MTKSHTNKKPRHNWLYALPQAHMPEQIDCAGQIFHWTHTFKHDFFAATGTYQKGNELAVLKIGRMTSLFGIPMKWIGKFLCNREVAHYQRVQDLPGIPKLIGRVDQTGFLHAFVPGRPLGRDDSVSDTFFDELQSLLDAIHTKEMAYVDLNKRQNILLGDDGRPYLIDFQISLYCPPTGWGRLPGTRWLLRRFQHADRYHLLKHKRRLRPDQLTEPERLIVERLSIWIRLHRLIARPLTLMRRWLLRRLAKSETVHVPGSDAK